MADLHYDLCIIGSGSGNSIPDERFADWKVAMVDRGVGIEDVFGGTCLNVGCIPTKMFVHPADLAASVDHARALGVDLSLDGVAWKQIHDRIFGRIDPIAQGGEEYRAGNVDLYRGTAEFVADKRLRVGDTEFTADRIVLAAGSRPRRLDCPGADQIVCHTSDTVMHLSELPETMVILGGGFIAAEFAHIFGSFGVDVTIINRSPLMLRQQDEEVARRFTELAAGKWNLRMSESVTRVEPLDGDRVRIHTRAGDDENGTDHSYEADVVLLAVGRVPNSDTLNLSAGGVEVDEGGLVIVDEYQRTTADGVWALGDVSSEHQLKHVANHEAKVVQHNLLHPDNLIASDHRYVPGAVFSKPQVASVGLTEADAKDQGLDYVTAVQEYGSIAYGWAMEDTEHFAKLIADRSTGKLLGGHIMGPQAATLIQPVIQALHFDLGAREMATGQYWIHPAMPELIENALLSLPLEDS
ncbi:mycothione reductase [Enemella sp. A6]|uniref:mycothione reductase n=1 Tax=Enemella sp. A6 TaxID=3440152 RepID=UPI003EB89F50